MQWAVHRALREVSKVALPWKPGRSMAYWNRSMVSSESMSPSQAAGMPRSRSRVNPRQGKPLRQPAHAGADGQSVGLFALDEAVQGAR